MAVKIYTFKLTYANCDNRIWRIAAVSSNYTLDMLGYMLLATFDTAVCHLFEMKYKNTYYSIREDDCASERYSSLKLCKIDNLGMNVGDILDMTYDLGCEQTFHIELLNTEDMPMGHGTAYPKILDGAGRGIVDNVPAFELLDVIQKIDRDGHSEIYYSSEDSANVPEWDYRNYNIDYDNALLKGTIDRIRDMYENMSIS